MFFYTFLSFCKENSVVAPNKIIMSQKNSIKNLNLFKFCLQKKIKECIKGFVTRK